MGFRYIFHSQNLDINLLRLVFRKFKMETRRPTSFAWHFRDVQDTTMHSNVGVSKTGFIALPLLLLIYQDRIALLEETCNSHLVLSHSGSNIANNNNYDLYIKFKIIFKVIVISHKACLKMLMTHQVQPQYWHLALKHGS